MQRPSLRFRSEEYFVYIISEEMFTQIYRDLYGDAMLMLIPRAPTWRTETNRNICH